MTNPKEEKNGFYNQTGRSEKRLIGEIIFRIEKRGLKIIALDMVWASQEEMDSHYPKDEAWIKTAGRKVYGQLSTVWR